jgi:hypothetical protein
LAIPQYAAGISALFLVIRSLARWPAPSESQKSWRDTTSYGGTIVLIHNFLRFLASLTIFGLSVTSLVFGAEKDAGVEQGFGLELGLCGFYVRAVFTSRLRS